MRKNYSNFREINNDVQSIWARVTSFSYHAFKEITETKNLHILNLGEDSIFVRARDPKDRDFHISFESDTISALVDFDEQSCIINDFELSNNGYIAELYFFDYCEIDFDSDEEIKDWLDELLDR